MLTSGDVVLLDLGLPTGREAGMRRPAVVVTADPVLEMDPSVVHVVPLTTTSRGFATDVLITPGKAGIDAPSVAQCQHIRSVSTGRINKVVGRVGTTELASIRSVLGLLLDVGGPHPGGAPD